MGYDFVVDRHHTRCRGGFERLSQGSQNALHPSRALSSDPQNTATYL